MKLAFLTYNRDPSVPSVDNDGNPVTVRNYCYWLAKYGHKIDIFVNKVVPNETSSEYVRKKFKLQKEKSLELFPGVKVIRVDTNDLTAKDLSSSVELQEIPEIIQSVLSANYFKNDSLDDYDLICIFHPLTSFGIIFQELIPLSKTILFPMLLSDEYLKFGSVSPIYIRLEQKVLESVAKIFSNSLDEKERLLSRSIPRNKIEVIQRGIDLDSFAYKQKELPNNTRRIDLITVGSIRPQKRQHILVDVVENLISLGIDVKLNIVGENKLFTKQEYKEYYEKLRSSISDKGLRDNIFLTGGVEPDDVSKLLSSSDIALFPSVSESFGKAALESICVGTPTIVAKECPAYQEFARDKENALIVSSDPITLTKGVLELLKDKDLYSRLSKNGKSTRNKFSWEIVSKVLDNALTKSITKQN